MIGYFSISNEQIMQAIDDANKNGFKVGMRDIAYVFLCKSFEDISSAYRCIFGADKDYNQSSVYSYDSTGSIQYLRSYIETNFTTKKKKNKGDNDISFEENKAEILRLIKDTQDALANEEIDVKDALKIEADLRIKLNDKFQVREEDNEQYVIVNTKYNSICDKCGAEIYIPTKEDLMAKYNLKEK